LKAGKTVPQQLIDILFVVSAAGVFALSLAVVLVKNPVRSILFLILSFLPTALIYIMLQAPFVGILQILVYGGAIMMLFTFVIMMINPAPKGGEIPGENAHPRGIVHLIPWLLLMAAAGFILIPPVYRAALELPPAAVSKPGFGGLPSLANLIFKDPANNPFTVSFELISFLILAGIIAALNFSRHRARKR
jgi:NADH-quinone oxidoreductase subunit J